MSDKTSLALAECRQSTTVAFDALQTSEDPTIDQDLETLRRDYQSLLSLTYSAATKVALSLKPPKPDYQASLVPIKDLANSSGALATCATLFSAARHGPAMRKKARSLASDVINAVRQLSASLEGGDVYVLTGTIHDAIDSARTQLPESEAAAVREVFRANQACLDDGIPELNELMQEPEDGDDADGEGDGWDELDEEFGEGLSSKALTPEERQRVTALFPLLKIVTQLHKKIMVDCLAASLQPPLPLSRLIALDPLSTQLLTGFEDAVSSLYGPQSEEAVNEAVVALLSTASALRSHVEGTAIGSVDSVAEQLSGVVIDASSTTTFTLPEKTKKWLQLCFAQIDKLSQTALPVT